MELMQAQFAWENLKEGTYHGVECQAMTCAGGITLLHGSPCMLCKGTGLNLKTHQWSQISD